MEADPPTLTNKPTEAVEMYEAVHTWKKFTQKPWVQRRQPPIAIRRVYVGGLWLPEQEGSTAVVRGVRQMSGIGTELPI